MTQPSLLVLAAGMGSRYGGLKQLDTVGPNGETIMDYSIFDARRAGFGKVVFVIRRDMEEAFHAAVGQRYADRIPVAYAFQELDALPQGFDVPDGRTKPWGTGHAILVARDFLNEPFAVINADDFYGQSGLAAAAEHLRNASDDQTVADYSMVGYRLSNTLSEHGSVSRGVCQVDEHQALKHVVETHEIRREGQHIRAADPTGGEQPIILTGDERVSMNLWGFTPSIFDHLEHQFTAFLRERGGEAKSEFYIPSVVNQLIQTGQARVAVQDCDASWIGVTFKEDKPRVQQRISAMIHDGVYASPLWSD